MASKFVEGREHGQTEEQHIRFVVQRCADYAKKHEDGQIKAEIWFEKQESKKAA